MYLIKLQRGLSITLRGAANMLSLISMIKRVANLGEVFDEVLIEVSKANEALYFFEAFGNRPVNDGFNLD
jgi:hypothetical protein